MGSIGFKASGVEAVRVFHPAPYMCHSFADCKAAFLFLSSLDPKSRNMRFRVGHPYLIDVYTYILDEGIMGHPNHMDLVQVHLWVPIFSMVIICKPSHDCEIAVLTCRFPYT